MGNFAAIRAIVLAGVLILPPSAGAQATSPVQFSSTPACGTCSIDATLKVTLSLPLDSLSFVHYASLTRLAEGGFVVARLKESRLPAVFDAAGRFQRFAAPLGQGPGEIANARAVVRAEGDSIWIIDGARKHVFTPDMRYVRQDRVGSAGSEYFVADDGAIVSGGIVGTSRSAGFPLHLVNRSFEVLKSFGLDDPTLDPRRLAAANDDAITYLQRKFVRGGPGSFWAYNESRFLLERYDSQGRLLDRVRHALDGWYRDATERWPSPGEHKGLALTMVVPSQAANILWLVYQDRRPNYVPFEGFGYTIMKWAANHDLVVEAFDTNRREVLAVRRFPMTSAMRVAHGVDVLALVQPIDDVFFTFQITSLRLSQSSLQRR